jgi:hypothetical protein
MAMTDGIKLLKVLNSPYYKWTEALDKEFIARWRTSEVVNLSDESKPWNINWNSDLQFGGFWIYFDECASVKRGRPADMCHVCFKKYQHPNYNSIGAKAIHNHSKRSHQKLAEEQKRQAQLTLAEMVTKMCYL